MGLESKRIVAQLQYSWWLTATSWSCPAPWAHDAWSTVGLSRLGSRCGCRSGYVYPLIRCAVGVSGHVLCTLGGEATKALKTIEHLFYTSHYVSCIPGKKARGGGWALRTKTVDNKALSRTVAESVLSDFQASAIVPFLRWHKNGGFLGFMSFLWLEW